MSPGSTPGAWSASPENVIFCPCLIPLSTWTSRSFVSLHTLWPSHFLQRSFSLITSPVQKTTRGRRRTFIQNCPRPHACGPLTLSAAVCADRLHLLDHPGGQLSHHDSHASPSARHALLHGARLTSLAARQHNRKASASVGFSETRKWISTAALTRCTLRR